MDRKWYRNRKVAATGTATGAESVGGTKTETITNILFLFQQLQNFPFYFKFMTNLVQKGLT